MRAIVDRQVSNVASSKSDRSFIDATS